MYSDIQSAYYSVIREYVVGFIGPEAQLRACLDRLGLSTEVAATAINFVNTHGSLLQLGQADPALVEYMRCLNDDTWFVINGSEEVVRTSRGARAGEATADLIFIFLFGRVTKQVRTLINESPYWIEFPYSSTGILSARDGLDTTTDDAEVAYADDVMHAYVHKDPSFIAEAIRFTAAALVHVAALHGLKLNFGPGKTEALLSLRGSGAKALRKAIVSDGGLCVGPAMLSVVCTYKHLGTLATSTGCPHAGRSQEGRSRKRSVFQVL